MIINGHLAHPLGSKRVPHFRYISNQTPHLKSEIITNWPPSPTSRFREGAHFRYIANQTLHLKYEIITNWPRGPTSRFREGTSFQIYFKPKSKYEIKIIIIDHPAHPLGCPISVENQACIHTSSPTPDFRNSTYGLEISKPESNLYMFDFKIYQMLAPNSSGPETTLLA